MNHIVDHSQALLLSFAFEQGYKKCLEDFGQRERLISQRKAHKLYTKGLVDAWERKGLVHPKKVGDAENSKIYYNVQELEIAAQSSEEPRKRKNTKP